MARRPLTTIIRIEGKHGMFSKHSLTRKTLSLAALALPATLLVLTACGGGGGGGTAASGGPAVVGTQMGGSRQGVPLALASAPASATVSTFGGQYWGNGADGTGPLANFNWPMAAVSDGQGNLYVADTSDNTIRKIVIATGVTNTLAGQVGVTGAADGAGTAAQFTNP